MTPLHMTTTGLVTVLSDSPESVYNQILRKSIATTSHPEVDYLLGSLRAKQYGNLLEWAERPSPQLYSSATEYFVEAQLSAMIRKYPFSSNEVPGLNPELTGLTKFLSAEHRCKWVNRKFRARRNNRDPYAQFHKHMRSFIEKVMGSEIPHRELYDYCDLSPGANIGIASSTPSIARKIFANTWSCSPTALSYALPSMWSNIHVRDCVLPGAIKCYDFQVFKEIVMKKVKLTSYNKISFVPKTARTHRPIAVEPLLNGFLQKGVDKFLRQRLITVGADLSDQTRNQNLSRLGSEGGLNPFVTIDLSAASDSLATEVVRDMVPPAWFEYLNNIRSPSYMLPGHKNTTRYEKFCSMGNGFCFPLETLIFLSVCYAVARYTKADFSEVSVYGDDIIVRQSDALLVIEVLRDMGFKTNVDKTFIFGPFRESCGSDWFAGQDVRPVYVSERLTDVRQLFALHNSMQRSVRCDLFFYEVLSVIRSIAGEKYLRPGREPGDTCYSVPLDIAMSSPYVRWHGGTGTWEWKELLSLSIPDPTRMSDIEYGNILLLAAMRGHTSHKPFTLRYTSKPKVARVRRPYYTAYGLSELPGVLSRKAEVLNSWFGVVRSTQLAAS